MDKRTFDLMKRAQMTKEAGAISTAKNPAKQWGIDAKGEAKKGTTTKLDNTDALKKGISTDKNPACQMGDEEKKASNRNAILEALYGMRKQAGMLGSAATWSAIGTPLMAGAGAGLAAATGKKEDPKGKRVAKGAAYGAGAGVLGGAALGVLIDFLQDPSRTGAGAGDKRTPPQVVK